MLLESISYMFSVKRNLLRSVVGMLLLLPGLLLAQFQLEPDFGNQGKLRFQVGSFHSSVDLVPVGTDRLLLLADCGELQSNPNLDIALLKFDFNGELDSTFGDSGVVRFDFEGMDMSTGSEIHLLPDGKILVLGETFELSNQSQRRSALCRLWPNGEIDSTFGNQGTVFVSFLGVRETPKTLEQDILGRIIIGGGTLETTHGGVLIPTLALLDSTGVPDSSFGGTGLLAVLPDSVSYAFKNNELLHVSGGLIYDQVPLLNGNLLIAGTYSIGQGYNVGFISRLLPDGQLDSTFNNTGTVYLNVTSGINHQVNQLEVLSNGQILFTINGLVINGMDFIVGTLNPDGSQAGMELIHLGGDDEVRDIVPFGTDRILCGVGEDQFGISWLTDLADLTIHSELSLDFDPMFASEGQAGAVVDGNLLICAGRVETADPAVSDLALVGIRLGTQTGGTLIMPASDGSIDLFPNPANDHFFLTCSPGKPLPVRIQVSSSLGHGWRDLPVSSTTSHRISTSHWANGIYHVLFTFPTGDTEYKKVVVQH